MAKTNETARQFENREEDLAAACSFVEGLLGRADISKEGTSEALLVFEALFRKLSESELGSSATLNVWGSKRLGDLSLRIGFEGKPFVFKPGAEGSIEDKILEAHSDKLDCSYRTGYNVVAISVSRSYRWTLLACSAAAVCAAVCYAFLYFLTDAQMQRELLDGYVFPLENLYTNAVLMVGAPMTFFSLLKNLTDTYVLSQRSSSVRKLQRKTTLTSLTAIVLAFAVGLMANVAFDSLQENVLEYSDFVRDRAFSDVVPTLLPPSILDPFESVSPIPILLVAMLVTYALCSTSKHFDMLKDAVEAAYALFSRMLRVVIAVLPAFCFFAFLDVLLDTGLWGMFIIFGCFVVFNVGLILLFGTYALRLHARNIDVGGFTRKLLPLIRENIKIGSAIDAVPFNVRYCARNYGFDRKMLQQQFPVLAQINLDGNCYMLMLISLAYVFTEGLQISLLGFAGLTFLVFFLSLGAPGQPGGILIGTLIVTTYLHSYSMLGMAIYAEALLGGAQNIINVIGDVVIVAIEAQSGE